MKDRQPLIDLLQEWLGYKISTDTSMQKICFLWGRPRSGKGTILHIEAELVGRHNVAFPKIETLAGRFGLQGLIPKSSAQVTDMNCEDQKQLSAAATNLNGVSGEDGQTVERKGITDWHGKLGVRFTLAGNTLPNFRSHTGAMATRLLIIPFDVSFEHREDRSLKPKLEAELQGIMNWALDGLDRLRMCGEFSEPEDRGRTLCEGHDQGILRNMFGLRSAVGTETQQKLDERSRLLAIGDGRTKGEEEKLKGLSQELVDLGFGREFRDPDYAQFVRAMARSEQPTRLRV